MSSNKSPLGWNCFKCLLFFPQVYLLLFLLHTACRDAKCSKFSLVRRVLVLFYGSSKQVLLIKYGMCGSSKNPLTARRQYPYLHPLCPSFQSRLREQRVSQLCGLPSRPFCAIVLHFGQTFIHDASEQSIVPTMGQKSRETDKFKSVFSRINMESLYILYLCLMFCYLSIDV